MGVVHLGPLTFSVSHATMREAELTLRTTYKFKALAFTGLTPNFVLVRAVTFKRLKVIEGCGPDF